MRGPPDHDMRCRGQGGPLERGRGRDAKRPARAALSGQGRDGISRYL